MAIVALGNRSRWRTTELHFLIVKGLLKDTSKRVCVPREKTSHGDAALRLGDKFLGDIYFVFELESTNVPCS